jgi:electron-transferring-flavoprotein dehydrogenase
MHTLGYPLRQEEFGGGFIYAMPDRRLSIGLVVGLDYRDPMFDPHTAFNQFKRHPFMSALLEGGQMIRYGAKALPEGGWNTIPQLYMDGALIAGDAGGFVNSMRLKGIHLAMRTGMLAAETAYAAIRSGDTSAGALRAYQDRVDASAVRAELFPVRNVHQAFGTACCRLAFAGSRCSRRRWLDDLHGEPGHEHEDAAWYYGMRRAVDRSNARRRSRLTFDKLTNVHYSGTAHEEDQPSHLLVHTEVCSTICGPEYGHPCTRSVRRTSTRSRASRRHAAAADQRVELRALQDVRHHGPVPGASPGCRPKGAAVLNTMECRQPHCQLRTQKIALECPGVGS